MDILNLTLVGWLFAVGSGLALGLGIWVILGLHSSGEGARKHLAERVLDDSLLFGIWILGMAGASGCCWKSHGAAGCWSCFAGR